jgi:hypothetical protein
MKKDFFLYSEPFGREAFSSVEDAAAAAVNHCRIHGIKVKLEASDEERRTALAQAIAASLY